MSKRIPEIEAEILADRYGYDQVIILAQNKAEKSGWVDGRKTSFNKNKKKSKFLGRISAILSHNLKIYYNSEWNTENSYKELKRRLKHRRNLKSLDI